MKRKISSDRRVETVFVLMIFCVFAVSVLLVLMLSGSTYQNMNDIAREGQNERIVLSYIRTKIRSLDNAASISVGTVGESSALFLEEDIYGRHFVTVIYFQDGWVRELFHEQGHDLMPQAGVPIIQADSLSFEMVGNDLIRVSTDLQTLLISPRSAANIGT